jgi:hypothetical protein
MTQGIVTATQVSRRQLPVVLEIDTIIEGLKSKAAALEDNAFEDHLSVPFGTVAAWLRDLDRIQRHLRAAANLEG